MTIQCPICHICFVRPVLEDYHVHAVRGPNTPLGGLQVLSCSNGHIFFVRKQDVSMEMVTGAAAA